MAEWVDDPNFRSRYWLFICPECGENFQFAGFCDGCSVRLQSYSCITFEQVIMMRDYFINSMGIDDADAAAIEAFVDALSEPSG